MLNNVDLLLLCLCFKLWSIHFQALWGFPSNFVQRASYHREHMKIAGAYEKKNGSSKRCLQITREKKTDLSETLWKKKPVSSSPKKHSYFTKILIFPDFFSQGWSRKCHFWRRFTETYYFSRDFIDMFFFISTSEISCLQCHLSPSSSHTGTCFPSPSIKRILNETSVARKCLSYEIITCPYKPQSHLLSLGHENMAIFFTILLYFAVRLPAGTWAW